MAENAKQHREKTGDTFISFFLQVLLQSY